MATFTAPPPTPAIRARDWVHWNLYELGQIRTTRDHSYSVTDDGRIMESSDRTGAEQVGSWRMDGDNLIIEIEDY